ncbi:gamma-glutamyltransferase family protein [Caballeronia sp. LZ062]|uniref:gamma-glutamyltransferase family protein n=1 Tax=unclassified Caballeronia TaxID=2646786 RepID=UPI0028655E94|nr:MULTISPECIES: gamma-glutamyltransferase family protein [unclassified Caballeronia]MDR5856042.1 gamma-glutamyltransferase family protein [Caballeronia sp. LZ050]MDR5872713.1 gamma-glutamyltransferase family protein [Caballeronia sp. LZ062]
MPLNDPHIAANTLNPTRGSRGMAVAPHALASQSALAVLREGGNAVEAMIAAAATIAVVYPHMNSIGGDGFWLISRPGHAPIGIEACGAAAIRADIDTYRGLGLSAIPARGPLAANTVAGTVSGWDFAQRFSQDALGGRLPVARLLEDAIHYAKHGMPVTRSQADCIAAKRGELERVPGFAETFLPDSRAPRTGERFANARLAATLQRLADAGFDDFYRGDLARSIARDLSSLETLITLDDLERHRARERTPLALKHTLGTVYNMPPPTQGLVSLLILGVLDRVLTDDMDPLGPEFVHACVEATKLAFKVRDEHVTDPDHMRIDAVTQLDPAALDTMASRLSMTRAAPWGRGRGPGDTVWMGVVDGDGVAVSFIQSIYHEFGSGIVLPESGINWQNRGCSFSLDPSSVNPLMPGRRPFHTLNPALAHFADGRTMVYGNMGGDGQPQSQSAVFSRIARFGWNPQAAIDAPRWLLGRTWGQSTDSLKLEARFSTETVDALRALGHEVDVLASYDEAMGHAGAIVRRPDGSFEAGCDPRSDGVAAGW